MKLIIEIPEELYEAYKGKPPMLGDAGMDMIVQSIAQGIPYEERPHGKWKCTKQGGIPITDMCTNCYYKMKWYKNKYKYCPECGSEMEADDECNNIRT